MIRSFRIGFKMECQHNKIYLVMRVLFELILCLDVFVCPNVYSVENM
jgi:hypothetical protein